MRDFLSYPQPYLDDGIKLILQQQIDRLTDGEREILVGTGK